MILLFNSVKISYYYLLSARLSKYIINILDIIKILLLEIFLTTKGIFCHIISIYNFQLIFLSSLYHLLHFQEDRKDLLIICRLLIVADIPLSISSSLFFRLDEQTGIADYLLDTFTNSNGKYR